jgi:hypothetical protein
MITKYYEKLFSVSNFNLFIGSPTETPDRSPEIRRFYRGRPYLDFTPLLKDPKSSSEIRVFCKDKSRLVPTLTF